MDFSLETMDLTPKMMDVRHQQHAADRLPDDEELGHEGAIQPLLSYFAPHMLRFSRVLVVIRVRLAGHERARAVREGAGEGLPGADDAGQGYPEVCEAVRWPGGHAGNGGAVGLSDLRDRAEGHPQVPRYEAGGLPMYPRDRQLRGVDAAAVWTHTISTAA